MFERRLKVFLGLLSLITALILCRAAHLQIVRGGELLKKANESLTRPVTRETTRGAILDRKGRILASDEPCMDAAVDYRAISKNEAWLKEQAIRRLGTTLRGLNKEERQSSIGREVDRITAEIDQMWKILAQVTGKPLDQILETTTAIEHSIETRRRYLWYQRFKSADQKYNGDAPWYREWRKLADAAPDLDKFSVPVAEETIPHVIVSNVSNDVYTRLKKQSDHLPGLVLQPGKHRIYPFRDSACFIIGHLGRVNNDDMSQDPNGNNDLLHYKQTDYIGRDGLEALAELALRGQRGKTVKSLNADEPIENTPPVAGADVQSTIDIDLQIQIEDIFRKVVFMDGKHNPTGEVHEMHGAVVVLDVQTNEVLALTSYPTYDLNTLDDNYKQLVSDYINFPLLNRATQVPREPGSTVKTIVGLGAITDGIVTPDTTIECDGFLKINGVRQPSGRCWTQSRYGSIAAHHNTAPFAHPTGFLIYSDALQRSCNVYFETLGDKLGIDGLGRWYSRFGLGRKTYIGLPEATGKIPNPKSPRIISIPWFSAIGQSQVLATPIQMANVAATIARDGIWMRPRLLMDAKQVRPTTRALVTSDPDRVDLHISPAAMAACKLGMYEVVNTRAGTGNYIARHDLEICGKTGTAQASPFFVPVLDEHGQPVIEEGKIKMEALALNTPLSNPPRPNLMAPWYRGSGKDYADKAHAWYMGFAPRNNPKIAFAVMLEYGGSGGGDAGPVAERVIDALIEHGYLETKPQQTASAQR